MRPVHRWSLYALFAASGFAALSLQVIWQRVLSLHAGVDLFSATTVVAAFMAGLGLGSLLGGVWADRLSPRGALLAFAASKVGAGLYALVSLWLLYDGYRALVPYVAGMATAFAFHFVLLVIPTSLMGLSLPLLARGVVRAAGEIAPRVSRLYAANTLGAAAGAALTAYWLLGTFGFTGAVRLCAALSLLTGLGVFILWQVAGEGAAPVPREQEAGAPESPGARAAVPGWMLLYGLTGAAALGLEVLYFRIVDSIVRSNSYTFGHVLALYLLLLAAGTALASRWAGRTSRPESWFLWLQFGIGVFSMWGITTLVLLPKLPVLSQFVTDYFLSGGFMHGPLTEGDGRTVKRFFFAHLVAPLLLMGPPVFLMGASFPFIQAVVARRVESLGRRTGTLLAANILGNVAGSILTGFLLLDRLGTVGTLLLWCGGLGLAGLAAAWREPRGRHRVGRLAAAALVLGLSVAVVPSGPRLWAYLHGAAPERFEVVEDRACVNAYIEHEEDTILYINAAHQNGYRYDDFHILIGLLPSLMHPAPERALAVGLGSGSTAYGLLMDPRMQRIQCVEVCGGEIQLLESLARKGMAPPRLLLADPRARLEVGDGRKALLSAREPLQVVTVDVMRPQSAYSGNVYSVEFYELVKSRLAPDGLFAQWVPTDRVLHSAASVFPHMLLFDVPSYYGSRFMVASPQPLTFNREQVLARLAGVDLEGRLPSRRESITRYLQSVDPQPLSAEQRLATEERLLNHDLFPRDEYFLQSR
ncbi:MAG TPA: fused MFS/spermidine synthase [Myxococcaceae bacterium]|jgi:spermidine synthase